MAKKLEIELDSKGMAELLTGAEMQKYLNNLAQRKKAKLGKGYRTFISVGTTAKHPRATLFIMANSKKAEKDNLKNNTLLKALNDE